MSITLLWAVDVYGRVYSLSTASQRWERDDDMLLELKRVTAGKGRCWGVGCDHHIYLNMMPHETPIRYREETYENQVGLSCGCTDNGDCCVSQKLKCVFSEVEPSGRVYGHTAAHRPLAVERRDGYEPPTAPQLQAAVPQLGVGGRLVCGPELWRRAQPDWGENKIPSHTHSVFFLSLIESYSVYLSVSLQGWEYAVDFPANFSPDKKWNSCVRRRRWIRYRRYIAQGTWAKVWRASNQYTQKILCALQSNILRMQNIVCLFR